MKRIRDPAEGRWSESRERGGSEVASSIVIGDAPDIAHFLVLVLLVISCLACSSIGCFLGREPLDVL